MFSAILTLVRSVLQRKRAAREVDDELRFHLQMEIQSNVERGMSQWKPVRWPIVIWVAFESSPVDCTELGIGPDAQQVAFLQKSPAISRERENSWLPIA